MTNFADIARTLGFKPFNSFSGCYNLAAAVETATADITHYYDAGTMRYFKCRILKACAFDDGIIMATVCSQDMDGQGNRGFTFNFHACDGFHIGPDDRKWFKTSEAAKKAMYAFADNIDTRVVLVAMIERQNKKAFRLQQAAKAARKTLRSAKLEKGVMC